MSHVMPVEKVITKGEGKPTYHLGSLLPLNSYIILFDLFIQFMSNKLAIGRVLVHGSIDLKDCNEKEAKLFAEHYATLGDLITQYRRDIKVNVLNSFTEVTSFSNSYEGYFDNLVADIAVLEEDIESKHYEAVLTVYLELAQAFGRNKKNNAETDVIMTLKKLQLELNAVYEAFCTLIPKLAKKESEASTEVLQKTNHALQAITLPLVTIDEKYLQVVAFSEVGAALQTRTVAGSHERNKLVVCDTEKITQFYDKQCEQTLADLVEENKAVKQAMELNVLIAAWSKNCAALLATMEKMDEFWSEIEKNINRLKQFMAENKADEAARCVVVNQLEADRTYFGTLSEFAQHLELKTTIEVMNTESNANSLALSFLFKEVMPTISTL